MKKHRLPSGFRYLFTKKEIRDLESEIGIWFIEVGFGHITNPQRISSDTPQVTLHPVSLYGSEQPEGWRFRIHQSGFRDTLLTTTMAVEVKELVAEEIKRYLTKVTTFIETDFIQRPQLWIYCTIHQNKAEINVRELK